MGLVERKGSVIAWDCRSGEVENLPAGTRVMSCIQVAYTSAARGSFPAPAARAGPRRPGFTKYGSCRGGAHPAASAASPSLPHKTFVSSSHFAFPILKQESRAPEGTLP